MTLKQSGFEGTVSGDTVTASNGGTGNTNFVLGTAAGAPTAVYTSTSPAHGTRALRVTGTTTDQWRGYYSDTASNDFSMRMYYRPMAPTTGAITSIWNLIDSSFGNVLTIAQRLDNILAIGDKSGTYTNFTAALPMDGSAVYRIEVWGSLNAAPTTTNGVFNVRIYSGDSATILSGSTSISSTTANLGTLQFVRSQWGKVVTAGTLDSIFDDLAANIGSASQIGVYTAVSPPVLAVPATQTVAAGSTVSVTFSESGGAVDTRTTTFDYPTTGTPVVTNGGSVTSTFTAGAVGSLYIVRRTATNTAGSDSEIVEIRVSQTGDLRPLAMASSNSSAWTTTGGTTGAVLADESDTSYIESPVLTSTATKDRRRYQPSVSRTDGTVSIRLDKYAPDGGTVGTATVTASLFSVPTGGTALETWSVPVTTTITNQTHTLLSSTISAITAANAWGNLYLEISATS